MEKISIKTMLSDAIEKTNEIAALCIYYATYSAKIQQSIKEAETTPTYTEIHDRILKVQKQILTQEAEDLKTAFRARLIELNATKETAGEYWENVQEIMR